MAKVLVTGGTGFIGSHLAAALLRHGDEVTCLVRKTSLSSRRDRGRGSPAERLDRLKALGVTIASGDVTDRESLTAPVAGKSIVYHLAGRVAALTGREFLQVNRQGVENLAQACAEQPDPPVLLMVSSLAAAGPAPPGRLRTETDPLRPVSDYGRSKRAGEQAAEQFADRVPVTVVRPPIVFGEADKSSYPWFQSVERYGVHLVPGLKPRRFSLIHADDLCELLILAAERGNRLAPPQPHRETPRAGGYYFAASEDHPTYHQLGQMIGEALGHRRTLVIGFPTPMVWAVAGIGELVSHVRRRPVYLGMDKAREATAGSWACSAQKAKDELGFSPGAPLPERIRQTAQWYRQEGWL